MKKVVLAGGTGNLGRLLTRSFLDKGDQVLVLSRQGDAALPAGVQHVHWDGRRLGDWVAALAGADVLINLCGESINRRFTEENKRILRDSRIGPTMVLGEAIKTLATPPKRWINFSGISIFEDLEGIHDERSEAVGTTFLAQLTKVWEEAFWSCHCAHTQQVIVRISPVLMPEVGMFAELRPLVRYGLGGQVGSGRQYVSWIHKQDFVRLIHWVADTTNPQPVYHACSPNPETNAVFMRKFRAAVGMPMGLPLPTFMARVGARLKGVDAGLLLGSVAATSSKAQEAGFEYNFARVEDALGNLLLLEKK